MPRVPCKEIGHATAAQAGHPELESVRHAHVVNSRGLRQAGAARSRISCEIPSAFSTRGQRAVFLGYPGGRARSASETLGSAGETGGSFGKRGRELATTYRFPHSLELHGKRYHSFPLMPLERC